MPLVALTGGSGFLGRQVLRALLAAGWRVRMLARRDPDPPVPAGVELVRSALEDAAALRSLVSGAAAVVHAAGRVTAGRRGALFRTNALGSGAVAAAMAGTAPGARLVLISSQAARAPTVSAYAASKRQGEVAALAALGLTGAPGAAGGDAAATRPWVVLRPCALLGPGDPATDALLRLAARPWVPVPWRPEPRLALLHVADAAAAVAALCRADAPSGCHYELCDARTDGYGWAELLGLCAAAAGRPAPRPWPVPGAALLAAGAVAEAWGACRGRPAFFGIGKAREWLHRDWTPDLAALPPAALWRPRRSAAEALREAAARLS